MIWCKPNDLVQAKWLFSSSQMIWSAPNNYLVKPKDLERSKWLFGSSQMIWRRPKRAKWFGVRQVIIWCKLNDLACSNQILSVENIFFGKSALAVSSSPMPWIAVLITPEKINVFQLGGDWERCRTQGPKNVHNFLITVRKMNWACGHVTEMLLILKNVFNLIIRDQVLYICPSKKNVLQFCTGSICFSHWG